MAELTNFGTHTLLMVTTPKSYSPDDVTALLDTLAAEYQQLPGCAGKVDYIVNYVRFGQLYVGYCFVYIRQRGFYNVLLGLEVDGKSRRRIEYAQQGNRVPQLPVGFNELYDWHLLDGIFAAWTDALVVTEHDLPPLLGPFPAGVWFQLAKFDQGFLAKSISTLEIDDVPEWLTEDVIRPYFTPYNTVTGYPFCQKRDNHITITYNNRVADALVAFYMTRRLEITHRKKLYTFSVRQPRAGGPPPTHNTHHSGRQTGRGGHSRQAGQVGTTRQTAVSVV